MSGCVKYIAAKEAAFSVPDLSVNKPWITSLIWQRYLLG